MSNNLVDKLLREITNNYEIFSETKNQEILKSSLPISLYNTMIIEYHKNFIDSHKMLKIIPCE